MSLPYFTELTAETGLAYAHELAAVFGLTLGSEHPEVVTEEGFTSYEYLLIDGSIASVWLEAGHVYGEC